jgi:hypothetical protein
MPLNTAEVMINKEQKGLIIDNKRTRHMSTSELEFCAALCVLIIPATAVRFIHLEDPQRQ